MTWCGAIERGVPIPKRRFRTSKWKTALREMKVGDSILVYLNGNAASCGARDVLGAGNYKTRMEGDGYRIWRKA